MRREVRSHCCKAAQWPPATFAHIDFAIFDRSSNAQTLSWEAVTHFRTVPMPLLFAAVHFDPLVPVIGRLEGRGGRTAALQQ